MAGWAPRSQPGSRHHSSLVWVFFFLNVVCGSLCASLNNVFIEVMVTLFFMFLIKENQLYYDPATGIYYYCDVESGRYQFHSRVDLQSYQASGTQHTKDKKGKKKRKEPERITANEYKVTLELTDRKCKICLVFFHDDAIYGLWGLVLCRGCMHIF